MKGHDTLMSADKPDWRTPQYLFDALHEEFGFTVDAAADSENALLTRYWTDAMAEDWGPETVFCNPPYGRQSYKFIRKGPEAKTAVFLVAARTDTYVWHDTVLKFADEIRFIIGRVRFEHPEKTAGNGATFPSAVVVFRGRTPGVWKKARSIAYP